jgi:hypothetical protein
VERGTKGDMVGAKQKCSTLNFTESSHGIPLVKLMSAVKMKKTKSSLKTSDREKEFSWACLMVSRVWTGLSLMGIFNM